MRFGRVSQFIQMAFIFHTDKSSVLFKISARSSVRMACMFVASLLRELTQLPICNPNVSVATAANLRARKLENCFTPLGNDVQGSLLLKRPRHCTHNNIYGRASLNLCETLTQTPAVEAIWDNPPDASRFGKPLQMPRDLGNPSRCLGYPSRCLAISRGHLFRIPW
jgi:hypothetical protein